MMIAMLFLSVILFVLADLGVRELLRRAHEGRQRAERAQALTVGLRLDCTRESKTLKRVEVQDPSAKILCVDDEEVVLDSFRKILVLDGYCVDTVQTGQEALGLIQSHHYDFVFTDLKMPAMDGVDVVKSVKHLRPDMDVVVITGFATVETAVDCMKHGAVDYVQKPFTEDELLAFAKKALIRRKDRIERQLKPQVSITHLSEGGRARTGEFSIPGGVFVSAGHCWASLAQDGTARVGLDDFARKLLGSIDGLEFPNVGMTVKAGQPLFSARQKNRRAQFHSPIGGRVVKVNAALGKDSGQLESTPYQGSWVCVIEAGNLDGELPALKIGKAAVTLFEEDIERVRAFLRTAAKPSDAPDGSELCVGGFERLDDAHWDLAVKEFFQR
ncbi:MAG: response regulator [Elusimicrobia bacterium]|nr:response regulator [Elusimicrobiota bacterium]